MTGRYFAAYRRVISNWKYLALLLVLTVSTSFVFTWFFSLDVILYVINSGVSLGQKALFFIGSITSVYGDIFSLHSMVFVAFSVIFASNIMLLVYLSRRGADESEQKLSNSTMGAGLVGAGCVACGGSVITPVLSMLGIGATAQLSQTISLVAFIVASIFGLYGAKILLDRIQTSSISE